MRLLDVLESIAIGIPVAIEVYDESIISRGGRIRDKWSASFPDKEMCCSGLKNSFIVDGTLLLEQEATIWAVNSGIVIHVDIPVSNEQHSERVVLSEDK